MRYKHESICLNRIERVGLARHQPRSTSGGNTQRGGTLVGVIYNLFGQFSSSPLAATGAPPPKRQSCAEYTQAVDNYRRAMRTLRGRLGDSASRDCWQRMRQPLIERMQAYVCAHSCLSYTRA
jgi:hypothetical protein